MKNNLKKIIIVLTIVIITGIISISWILFSSNTNFSEAEVFVEIPTDSNYEEAQNEIVKNIEGKTTFLYFAEILNYRNNFKPGRFLFKNGMSSYQLLRALHKNIPVRLVFNNQERLENLVGRISEQIEPDSLSLFNIFRDTIFLKENGFNEENILAMFIPNTYEFYWNISASKFREKMLGEYLSFWNKERRDKAQKQGLTPIEVMILASIVHKESVKKDERPRIAGVYLNRLRKEMPLQADPTIIFAIKRKTNDFEQIIKRVFYNDLLLISPYNTYKNIGLPPGPISMPDISAVEAVLSPEANNYLYFCANPDNFGYHKFASTLKDHNKNAKLYAQWIENQGIVR